MNEARDAATAAIGAVAWSQLQTAEGRADRIADALRRLLVASTEEEAKAAEWEIDNAVVVQGTLYSSAPAVVPVLMAGLGGELSPGARLHALWLLEQLVLGEPQWDVPEDADLGLRCRAAAALGRDLLYGLLADPDPRNRETLIVILDVVETDHRRLIPVLESLREDDPVETVREEARKYLRFIEEGE